MYVIGGVEAAFRTGLWIERPADKDQGRTRQLCGAHLSCDSGKGGSQDLFIRPGRAIDHSDRAVITVGGAKGGDHCFDVSDRKMDREGGPCLREVLQLLARGHD